MRARYVGEEPETVDFEESFPRDEWVEVDQLNDHARERLAEHPHFETEGYEPPAEAVEAAPKARKARAAQA